MNGAAHTRWQRAIASLRHEWREAPWFVVLIIVVTAFVGPGLLWAAWTAITELF
ncbi:MAG: hypothetical protein R8J94_08240 [Acidimicrobiia bacterium]|nr:hypothetical protein [Acidimicrobiia bacterium]